MLENLAIAFWAVCPLTLMILIGYAVGQAKYMSQKTISEANRMSMTVFFGCLSFYNIYNSTIDVSAGLRTALFCFLGVAVQIALCTVMVHKIESRAPTQGAMIQALYRGNLMMLGVPLLLRVCGPEEMGIMGLTTAFVIPLYNIAAVIVLESHRDGRQNRVSLKKTVISIFKNPLIIGTLSAILFQVLAIQLPDVLDDLVSSLAGAAAPIGLILLGASLDLGSLKADRRNLAICVIGKLVVIPVIAVTAAILFGLRGASLMTVFIIFGAPVPVAGYVMAESMGSDARLTSAAIVASTIFSCFTMFFGIFALKQLGLV